MKTPSKILPWLLLAALLLPCLPSYADSTSPEETSSPIRIKTPFRVISQGGTDLQLPPGYILNEPQWDKLDAEIHRLQTSETRLEAENKSLKDSATSLGGNFGLVLGALGVSVGVLIGALAF